MKNLYRIGFAGILAVVFLATGAFAQSETISAALGDKYVISAKAGGVNLVEGTAGVVRESGRSGLLIKGDKLEVGDRVSTGADGRAEILLNPGSYLRIGANTAFEFKSTSLDDLTILVDRGSAILEIFASNDFTVHLQTGGSNFSLVRTGIYRVDVAEGKSTLSVWKGRAETADGSEIKGGREAVVAEGDVSLAKFNRGDRDALEMWSKQRSKELAKMTSSLRPRDFRDPLMSAFGGRGLNLYDSFGLWVYNPFMGSYCFLPFGRGWSSPYGYWYGYDIWSYRLPWRYFQPPTQSGGGTVTPTNPQPSETRQGTRTRQGSLPPFVQVGGASSLPGASSSASDDISGSQVGRPLSRTNVPPASVRTEPSTPSAPIGNVREARRPQF